MQKYKPTGFQCVKHHAIGEERGYDPILLIYGSITKHSRGVKYQYLTKEEVDLVVAYPPP